MFVLPHATVRWAFTLFAVSTLLTAGETAGHVTLKAAADAYPDTIAGITARYHLGASLAAHGRVTPAVVIAFVLGFFMSLGKAAVYKHIPVYYPKHVGAVGGVVVSKPMAKNTTSFVGFSRAMRKASVGE